MGIILIGLLLLCWGWMIGYTVWKTKKYKREIKEIEAHIKAQEEQYSVNTEKGEDGNTSEDG